MHQYCRQYSWLEEALISACIDNSDNGKANVKPVTLLVNWKFTCMVVMYASESLCCNKDRPYWKLVIRWPYSPVWLDSFLMPNDPTTFPCHTARHCRSCMCWLAGKAKHSSVSTDIWLCSWCGMDVVMHGVEVTNYTLTKWISLVAGQLHDFQAFASCFRLACMVLVWSITTSWSQTAALWRLCPATLVGPGPVNIFKLPPRSSTSLSIGGFRRTSKSTATHHPWKVTPINQVGVRPTLMSIAASCCFGDGPVSLQMSTLSAYMFLKGVWDSAACRSFIIACSLKC